MKLMCVILLVVMAAGFYTLGYYVATAPPPFVGATNAASFKMIDSVDVDIRKTPNAPPAVFRIVIEKDAGAGWERVGESYVKDSSEIPDEQP